MKKPAKPAKAKAKPKMSVKMGAPKMAEMNLGKMPKKAKKY